MAAFDPATLDRWRALAIVDRDGTTVGTIREFYLDRETGDPTWALVETGLFNTTQTFVPLVHATEISDGLQVPYERRHIKDSPRVDLHDELTPEEEAVLFAHYGVDYEASPPAEETASTEPSGPALADPGSAASPAAAGTEAPAADTGSAAAGPPGPVPAEPGSAEVVEDDVAAEAVQVEHEPGEADGGRYVPDPATMSAGVPDEPGTTEPDETGGVGRDGSGSEALDRDEVRARTAGRDGSPDPDPASAAGSESVATEAAGPEVGAAHAADPDVGAAYAAGPEVGAAHAADPDPHVAHAAGPDPGIAGAADPADPHAARAAGRDPGRFQTTPAGPDPDQFGTATADPTIGRTAPVEPGLPGSTAASPYGDAATIDKGAGPFEQSVGEPLGAPDEAAWAPGAAGSFEEQEPGDPPADASDRWREAKLAAERDRIARSSAAQPEERSPLERARRRLERLVGGGQEPPDPDDISPAEREAAERARRARLGLDDQDHRRR